MTAKKMQVVTLAKTKAVLGAATRQRSGAATVDELAAGGLVVRLKDTENSVLVPPEELEVKEVDYTDVVFRDPLTYLLDDSGTVVSPVPKVNSVSATSAVMTVTLSAAAPAADKNVVVVVDAGPNLPPLRFTGKTVQGAATVAINISGVPPGNRLLLASVEGYGSSLGGTTF